MDAARLARHASGDRWYVDETYVKIGPSPVEVATDRAPVYPRLIDEFVSTARLVTEQYANNPVEADHGRLKARLRPMRGLKRLASTREPVISR